MRIFSLAGICVMLFIHSAFAYQAPGTDAPAGAEVYIVTFEEPGALRYEGGVAGLAGTADILRSRGRNAGSNPDVKAYREYLGGVVESYSGQVSAALGRSVTPLLTYSVRNSGMAIALTASEAQQVAQMPGVLEVRKDEVYELVTDAGPQWIGADEIWNGTATPDAMPNFGEGVIVGVLDTGVNMDHPSFSDMPEDNYTFINPFGDGVFIGACTNGAAPEGVEFNCNNKLIGAWDFADALTAESDGPEDNNGHGSHTASTATGNAITGPIPVSGNSYPAPSISGIAPHANLITYDVCFENCPGGSILAGIEQALMDGVDVVNFSISGGNAPWADADRGFLDLTGNGTLVNASAGNTSATVPDPVGNVNHRGPWVMTVANQTHNRINNNVVSVVPALGGEGADLSNMYGLLGVQNNFDGDVTKVAEWGGGIGDGQNFDGCDPWTGPYAADFTDQIVLVSRGGCNFSVKIDNAANAGAAAALIFNQLGVVPIVMGGIEATTIPSLMIGLDDGEALRDFLISNPGTAVNMAAATLRQIRDEFGSLINPGSLRGPNATFDVTKPDIGGPGTNILAAYSDVIGDPPQFAFLSGTSMSSPHSAGSSALLKSVHPDWSPTQIKSALMMTAGAAYNEVGAPATWDISGSGTLDLSKAALAGLLMDETFDNFVAAEPPGGDPGTLNLPSMRANDCDGTCEWTRTVCSALDVESAWTVEHQIVAGFSVSVNPTAFNLAPAGVVVKGGFENAGAASSCQTFTVSVTINDSQLVTDGALIFDQIILSEDSDQSPDLKLTITFLPTGIDL